MKSNVLAMAVVIGLGMTAVTAHGAPRHHARTATAMPARTMSPDVAAELAMRDREIAELKDALAAVQAKVSDIEERTDAQSDVNTGTAQAVEKLQADGTKVDKIAKLVNDTSVTGKLYVDISNVDQSKNHVKNASSGTGLDVKRAYVSVTHNFNDTWSANVTTDFNYIAADGETQLFIKKAYIQGKFNDAFVLRAGSADMPWIPFVENFYGNRYVENTLVDKLKQGNSADWGVNANGKLAGGAVDYSASVVNGGGYKNPTRSKGMDFEGRIAFTPFANTVIAVGGYSGDLGKDTETTKALHTATRGDALVAYAKGNNRLGIEYFRSSNWTTVLNPLSDKSNGFSLWGSLGFSDKLSAFARYDHVKPSKDLDPSLRDKYFNVGLQWDVSKGLKIAAVYKNDNLKDNVNETKTEEFGIFGEFAF